MNPKIDQMWLEEQAFKSSGCCFGRIDSISEFMISGKLAWIVRGWLLHETQNIMSVRFKLNDIIYSATPRLPRIDVQAAFPSVKHALKSGFSFVIDNISPSQIPDPVTLKFAGITFRTKTFFRGTLPPSNFNLNVNVVSPQDNNTQTKEADVLIISTPLTEQKLLAYYGQLVKQLEASNLSWNVASTNKNTRANNTWHNYGQYKYAIIFGLDAWKQFIAEPAVHVLQSNKTKIIFINNYDELNYDFAFKPTFLHMQMKDMPDKLIF